MTAFARLPAGSSRDLQAEGSKGPKAKPVAPPSTKDDKNCATSVSAGVKKVRDAGAPAWPAGEDMTERSTVATVRSRKYSCPADLPSSQVTDQYQKQVTSLTTEVTSLKKYKSQVGELLKMLLRMKTKLDATNVQVLGSCCCTA